jgi:hypothetical protein
MALTGSQITSLANAINGEWNLQKLTLFASDLNFNLDNEAPDGPLVKRAFVFINEMNRLRRDRELLQKLQAETNARLQNLADEFLKPPFFSPTGSARDAILLGKTAFIDRAPLRGSTDYFTSPNPGNNTRVLVVRGDRPCGKSYTWEFIRHLAVSAGATPQYLRLKDLYSVSPREMLENCFALTGMDISEIPKATDNPQYARVAPLLNWFAGHWIHKIDPPCWLAIDDINDDRVIPELREAALALARCAEVKKSNLWVILLGYNEPITDSDLTNIEQDQPQFPDETMVADHFVAITKDNLSPVTQARACDLAKLLFASYSPVDKIGMANIGRYIGKLSERLRCGLAAIIERDCAQHTLTMDDLNRYIAMPIAFVGEQAAQPVPGGIHV